MPTWRISRLVEKYKIVEAGTLDEAFEKAFEYNYGWAENTDAALDEWGEILANNITEETPNA